MGNDDKIMPLISSCSIACGGHFGDDTSIRKTVQLAKKYHVKVGAHPSFPDKDNFGRKLITLTKSELTEVVFHQLLTFYAVCETEEVAVNHIKLHGALYNYAAKDAATADAIVEAIVATKIRPKLYVPHASILAKKAENLIPLVYEAFIDRRYNNDLSLVSRTEPRAIIDAPEDAWQQLHDIIFLNEVASISKDSRPLIANTYCVHGDHPNSVNLLSFIHSKFREYSIKLGDG